MNNRFKFMALSCLLVALLATNLFLCASAEEEKEPPRPKLIPLDPGAKEYMRSLGGPPEASTMRSGLVVLGPFFFDETATTEKYEEVLVVLEGRGEMTITGGPKLQLSAGSVAYCPPRTEHDVICTGPAKLRYVYVVAIAE